MSLIAGSYFLSTEPWKSALVHRATVGGMATILAHLQVKVGREREFEAVASELYRATHRNETRVRRYEYWRGEKPGTYYTLLSFVDEEGFLEHQTSEHHEVAGPKLSELIADLRLEWIDPMQSGSPLSPTNRQPLRSDANELWTMYHARYAAKVQNWWFPMRAVENESLVAGGRSTSNAAGYGR
jgi:quinol monooxygenase YgiN